MEGISLELQDNDKDLLLVLEPSRIKNRVAAHALLSVVKGSQYADFHIFEEAVGSAASSLKIAQQTSKTETITERVAERRDTVAKFTLDEDEMCAHLTLFAPCGGGNISLEDVIKMAHDHHITRGVGRKRIAAMLEQVIELQPGQSIEEVVARGLPVRHGKDSVVVPLVANALDRVLRPQSLTNTRVDMRNLGEIICVKAGTPISKRLSPTSGRDGFTVTDVTIEAQAGRWVNFKLGEGTVVSKLDENVLLAEINGMPKFKNDQMWVDDTFICKGCNVGTGNINYDGAVLVNGDVTERMKIIATGDVTINGFVDSATIQAGGDIIITEGATGKAHESSHEYGTTLTAQGSVHVQHGQGLDIMCNGDVTIGKQLAYSRIVCRGSVTAGSIDNPNGNVFACEIQSQDAVRAGTLGAVSGSTLTIDFSSGFNSLLEKKDQLEDMVLQIQRNFKRHEDRVTFIKSKKIPAELANKVIKVLDEHKNEKELMVWLEEKAKQVTDAKARYTDDIGAFANQRLYPGVVIKLNNRTWKAEREYSKAKIHYHEHKWQYDPIF